MGAGGGLKGEDDTNDLWWMEGLAVVNSTLKPKALLEHAMIRFMQMMQREIPFWSLKEIEFGILCEKLLTGGFKLLACECGLFRVVRWGGRLY